MNTAESIRAGRAWTKELISFSVWALRTRARSTGRVRAGDIDIYYQVYGEGDPVLLLHGGFTASESWAPQIQYLARDHMVIAMDSRGHGRTTLGTMPMTYRQLGRDAAALIDRLGVAPVHVAGESDGGIAALALALERPELLQSMVLLGTSFNTDNYSPVARETIKDFLNPYSPAVLFVRGLHRMINPERSSWQSFFRRMGEMWLTLPDFTTEELGRIQTPTLVIGCDHDEFLSHSDDPLAVFKETAGAMPNARLVTIPGGTHTVNLEMPATVNNMIGDFYDELPSRIESDFSRSTLRGRGRTLQLRPRQSS
ncbi:MAG TPA: alpha/beta fold hydrolase [Candidatus Anoxymicrobiaceae bacterium]